MSANISPPFIGGSLTKFVHVTVLFAGKKYGKICKFILRKKGFYAL